ncbi:putative alpha-amylase, partial [Aureobasidium melanogenum]
MSNGSDHTSRPLLIEALLGWPSTSERTTMRFVGAAALPHDRQIPSPHDSPALTSVSSLPSAMDQHDRPLRYDPVSRQVTVIGHLRRARFVMNRDLQVRVLIIFLFAKHDVCQLSCTRGLRSEGTLRCSSSVSDVKIVLYSFLSSFSSLSPFCLPASFNTATRALEQTIAFFVNGDLSLLPAQQIRPHLSLVLRSNMHLDLSRPSVAHHNRASILSVVCSSSHPSNTVGVVPVVVELAVCEELACENQIGEFVAAGRWFRVVSLHAVEVTVEDAGVTVAAEKDQGVGERLEEAFDGGLDGLAGLGDNAYHGVDRHVLDQSIIEHLSQIRALLLADIREVVQEWAVVQRELPLHLVDPVDQILLVASPEFADIEQIVTESLQANLLDNPFTPVGNIFANLWMRVVQVRKHEEISITSLVVHRLTPALTLSLNLENRILARSSIIIRTTKMIPMVLLFRVFIASAIEVETQPCSNLLALGDLLVAVVGVYFNNVAFLFFVGGGFVVEYCVPVEADACVFGGGGEGEEFVFGAPFCGYAALLIKFAEIVQVVHIVAVALCGMSLALQPGGSQMLEMPMCL